MYVSAIASYSHSYLQESPREKIACRVDTLLPHRHHDGVWPVHAVRCVDITRSIQMLNFEKCDGTILRP